MMMIHLSESNRHTSKTHLHLILRTHLLVSELLFHQELNIQMYCCIIISILQLVLLY